MTPLRFVQGCAYPLGLANVDTDVIIPAPYLKTISRHGLGAGAFEALRRQPGNIFDDPAYHGAPILIAGANFGCGSSREHAVWALADLGIRAVLAPSFSDIFASNAFKNGIAAIVLPQTAIDRLLTVAGSGNILVDLEACLVTTASGDRFAFSLDPFRRICLLNGLDEIDLTLTRQAAIAGFEDKVSAARPWLSVGLTKRALAC